MELKSSRLECAKVNYPWINLGSDLDRLNVNRAADNDHHSPSLNVSVQTRVPWWLGLMRRLNPYPVYWIHFLWSAATCRVGNQVITNHPRILRQEEGGETGRGMSYGRGTLTVRHWSWELQLAGGRVMIMERAGHHLSACSSSSNDSGFYLFNLSLIAGVWFEFQLSYVTEGQFLSMLWKSILWDL